MIQISVDTPPPGVELSVLTKETISPMHMDVIRSAPHRRRNALTGEWILVSPNRTQRPWMGQTEASIHEKRPVYDPACYLCPGNKRANGETNPIYENTFIFTNDFSALLPGTPVKKTLSENPLFESRAVAGECRVICFSPRHDLTLAEMEEPDILQVVRVWQKLILDLGASYPWVQIFENKGAVMGCSNPHPHGQAWAAGALPSEAVKEDGNQVAYARVLKKILLLDYAEQETVQRERIVVENTHWIALVPFWATWPFETLLLPKRHVLRLPDLTKEEASGLSAILKNLLNRYDNLFKASFPYTMGWHGAPTDGETRGHWQLHAHFYPPLLRSADIKKFMVGYEMLAEAQRDITPEQAAQRLRDLPETRWNGQPGRGK
jgi:UDPglucose--hexose-1-phosphate uridylyltransferase